MKLINFTNRQHQCEALSQQLACDLRHHLEKQETVTLCLAGGSTPAAVYDALSYCDLEWNRVQVVMSDERWVPPSDPQSNEAMLIARLRKNRARNITIVPFFLPGMSIADAVTNHNQTMADWMPLDICLLGMGTDAHFASLFPDVDNLDQALDETEQPAVIAIDSPSQPVQRISLNFSAIFGEESRYLMITGPEKKSVIETAAKKMHQRLPISHLLAKCPTLSVYYSE